MVVPQPRALIARPPPRARKLRGGLFLRSQAQSFGPPAGRPSNPEFSVLPTIIPNRVGPLPLTDLAVAVLGADAAVYGFVIAFYVFSRGLQEQEKAVIVARLNSQELHLNLPEAKRTWVGIVRRGALVNILLAICTPLGVVVMLLAIGVLVGLDDYLVPEIVLFGVFLLVVEGWVMTVSGLNLSEDLRYLKGMKGQDLRVWDLLASNGEKK